MTGEVRVSITKNPAQISENSGHGHFEWETRDETSDAGQGGRRHYTGHVDSLRKTASERAHFVYRPPGTRSRHRPVNRENAGGLKWAAGTKFDARVCRPYCARGSATGAGTGVVNRRRKTKLAGRARAGRKKNEGGTNASAPTRNRMCH